MLVAEKLSPRPDAFAVAPPVASLALAPLLYVIVLPDFKVPLIATPAPETVNLLGAVKLPLIVVLPAKVIVGLPDEPDEAIAGTLMERESTSDAEPTAEELALLAVELMATSVPLGVAVTV
jgi:hypothetical protein